MGHLVFNSLNFQTVSKTGVKEPSGMKRDTSKIFTVPEEGELDSMNYSAPQYVSSVPLAINHESPIRRKQEIKSERPKGGIVHPLTPSVCATPLKDVDRVLHGNAMLICSSESGGENEGLRNSSKSDDDDIPDVVKEALRYVFILKSIFRNFVECKIMHFEDMVFMANMEVSLMINFPAIYKVIEFLFHIYNRCKRLNKLKNATSKKKLMKRKDPDRKSVSLPDLTSSIKPRLNGVPRAHQPELDKM